MELREGKEYMYSEPIVCGRRELVFIHRITEDHVWFEGITLQSQKCTVKEFRERATEYITRRVMI